VINNHGRISQDTRKKVLKTIKNLNYHPSRSARGLVSRKTGNIGFILTEEHFLRGEPFYSKIFLGVEFEARIHDYYILLATVSSSFSKGDSLPRFITERNFDGIIIAGKISRELINSILKYDMPLVFVDYSLMNGDYPTILTDNIKGGVLATNYLIENGHKNIAFIGGEISHPSIMERLQGYKLALDSAKLKSNDEVVITNDDYLSRQNGCSAAEILLNRRKDVTAIFAANDTTAIGVMQCLNNKGIKVPDDISVIGFDDVQADLLLDPPLTTISVPKLDMGTEAIQLLLGIINKENIKARKILVPVKLIIRESTKNVN
jgi:LacI family transcriptional regulator